MKTKLLFYLLIASIGTIQAQSVLIDGLYYLVDTASHTATVTYQHYDSQSNYSYLQSVSIPSIVTYEGKICSVDAIGSDAFWGCQNLTYVSIPASVTEIGSFAFCGCTSLRTINIPIAVRKINWCTFSNCASLENIHIPQGVTIIDRSAFADCSSLISVSIPNSVVQLGYWAFRNCSALESVELGDGLRDFGSGAFANCTSLYNVTFGKYVESVGENMFEGCTSLLSVDIPNSTSAIGINAFMNCSNLSSVKIGDNVSFIGGCAFDGCNNLQSVTLGSNIETIGMCAFLCCPISEIHYTGTLADWCSKQWRPSRVSCDIQTAYGPITKNCNCNTYDLYINDIKIENVVLPSGLTNIGQYAFEACKSLMSVTIPDNIKSIDIGAFSGCTNLTSVNIQDIKTWCAITFNDNPLYYAHNLYLNGELVTNLVIPNDVTYIGNNAFIYCDSLTTVTIGEGVTNIGAHAFTACGNLQSITCHATTPPSLGEEVFYYSACQEVDEHSTVCNYISLYVPEESLTLYQTSEQWRDFYPILPIESTNTMRIPTPDDVARAGYNFENNLVLCCYFDMAPCNDVYFTGTYNNWSSNLSNCAQFQPLSGFMGWYVVSVPHTAYAEGKPIQLDNNGALNWNYQSGDVYAWIHRGGNEAIITSFISGEASICYPLSGCYIYEMLYWKNHNTPCIYTGNHLVMESEEDSTCKLFHNGQIFIHCGEKTYTITGAEVK